MAGGFPRVLFPPLWCFPPRCAKAVPPCGLLTRLVALLSCVPLESLRASPCQTRAGSSLAAAGAPQLHASALQQRRRLAHRPANNINARTALCLGNDLSDPTRGKLNHHQFYLRWHEAQHKVRSGGCGVQEISNTYIASHHIQAFELANDAGKIFSAHRQGGPTPRRVAAVQLSTDPAPTPSRKEDGNLHKMVAALSKQVSNLQTSTKKPTTSTVALTVPNLPAPSRGGKGDRSSNTGRGGRIQSYNAVPRVISTGLPPPNSSRSDPRDPTYSNGRKCAHPDGATGNPSNVNWTPERTLGVRYIH